MPELKKVPVILSVLIKQVQKVMDLSTGNEDTTINVDYSKLTIPDYDSEEYGGTIEEFYAALAKSAEELVSPVQKRIDALLKFATAENYQNAKTSALATGNFLTSDLKGRIVQVMRGNQAFVELSAKECFERWKIGFMAKKAGAIKVLDLAKTMGEFGDDL